MIVRNLYSSMHKQASLFRMDFRIFVNVYHKFDGFRRVKAGFPKFRIQCKLQAIFKFDLFRSNHQITLIYGNQVLICTIDSRLDSYWQHECVDMGTFWRIILFWFHYEIQFCHKKKHNRMTFTLTIEFNADAKFNDEQWPFTRKIKCLQPIYMCVFKRVTVYSNGWYFFFLQQIEMNIATNEK